MNIRPAKPVDSAAIALIHVTAWRAAYRGMIPDVVLDSLKVETRELFWRGLLAEPHWTYVAERDSGIIGFCCMVRSRDGKAGLAEIAALYVSPSHWRQGAGQALCEAVFAAAVDVGFAGITLWVLAANLAAISFYAARGFSEDGATRAEMFSGGISVPEVRMTTPFQ